MKKIYRKPDLFFEDFELSANIAGNCAKEMPDGKTLLTDGICDVYGTFGNSECTYVDNGVVIFANYDSCMTTPDEDNDNNSDTYFDLCYHVPDGGIKMFAS